MAITDVCCSHTAIYQDARLDCADTALGQLLLSILLEVGDSMLFCEPCTAFVDGATSVKAVLVVVLTHAGGPISMYAGKPVSIYIGSAFVMHAGNPVSVSAELQRSSTVDVRCVTSAVTTQHCQITSKVHVIDCIAIRY